MTSWRLLGAERALELLIIMILVLASFNVNLTVFLLLLGPLAFVVKGSSSCL
jgi:hypothetical protein